LGEWGDQEEKSLGGEKVNKLIKQVMAKEVASSRGQGGRIEEDSRSLVSDKEGLCFRKGVLTSVHR